MDEMLMCGYLDRITEFQKTLQNSAISDDEIIEMFLTIRKEYPKSTCVNADMIKEAKKYRSHLPLEEIIEMKNIPAN